jgi:hypothetical protein
MILDKTRKAGCVKARRAVPQRIMRTIAANAGQGQKIGWRMLSCGAWIFNRKPSIFNYGGLLFFIVATQSKIKDLRFHRKPSR